MLIERRVYGPHIPKCRSCEGFCTVIEGSGEDCRLSKCFDCDGTGKEPVTVVLDGQPFEEFRFVLRFGGFVLLSESVRTAMLVAAEAA